MVAKMYKTADETNTVANGPLYVRLCVCVWQGAYKKYSSQSQYQGLSLCEELSPQHAQQTLCHLGRPQSPLPAGAAELSREF